ncbi:MAG: GNAT family N-acetyltransferase [Saprospiraceae bacterium]|nr:GNAT family N-acetyltransferase [Saprospiraceae bacterium]
MLTTDRLYLVPASFELLDAAARGDDASLSAQLGGVALARQWSHFPEALAWMRDYLREHPDEHSWWSYFIIHRKDVRLIGTAGYKGPPAPGGILEIGYEIDELYQGRGLATEVAAALIGHARAHDSVTTIVAHTLAEENASVAVLRKLGFSFSGEIIDLHDGKIWGWQLSVR